MRIKWLICDIDGSLMNPSSGLYVKDEVKNKLIELEEKGMKIILNSARTFQGVYPLSKQLNMEKYGGYVISCNGVHVYDVQTNDTVFEYPLEKEVCEDMWNICVEHGVIPSFTQPDYAVCKEFVKGYELDSYNCDLVYKVSETCTITNTVWKFSIAGTKEEMDAHFDEVKEIVEKKYNVLAVRSTLEMGDVVNASSSKYKTCDRLFKMLGVDWKDVSTIGDGTSDLECVKYSGLGVTLENAKENVKEVADIIVPSCFEDGCLEWLDYLLKDS